MLEFKTRNGNTYAWCDEVGLVIPLSTTMKTVLNEMTGQKHQSKEAILNRLNRGLNEEDVVFCYEWINKWKKILPKDYSLKFPQDISVNSIKPFLLKYGLRELILNITEDCNFRCKYCSYSDYYEYTRGYSKKHMNFNTAKRAIDLYASLGKEGRRYNPEREPYIGFFGGEPLLNFDLIKGCVEYIESSYEKWHYFITTNGSLLDKDKREWLVSHDFNILVSLDGPEEEHDRNRVFCDGRGTFTHVMNNVIPLLERGYEKIHSLAVFDPKSDFFKIENFFQRSDVPRILLASQVSNLGGCTYYKQFTKEDFQRASEQLDKARNSYVEKIASGLREGDKTTFFDALFSETIEKSFYGPLSLISTTSPLTPCTGTCVPGTKIFVDVDGNLHACERVSHNFPIGTVDEGLNYYKICELLKNYFHHMDKCSTCKVRKFCDKCFNDFCAGEAFSFASKVCQETESSAIISLSEAFSIAEINPEIINKMDNTYKAIKR